MVDNRSSTAAGLALALALAAAPVARADDDDAAGLLVVDEDDDRQPLEEAFLTELVYPQEQGETQLTFAPFYARSADGKATQSLVKVEYGLTDAWQVELEWNAYTRRSEDDESHGGVGDLEIGTK